MQRKPLWIAWGLAFLVSTGGSAIARAAEFEVPNENKEQPPLSAIKPFEADARRLVTWLNEGQLEIAREIFFPREAFLHLKAIAKPSAYYEQLIQWYANDLLTEHQKSSEPMSFVSFTRGPCQWKAKGSEANAYPYWTCYNNKIKVTVAGKERTISIRALINWGSTWYLTHLHPIPKK